MSQPRDKLLLYAVRNHEGKWLRARGIYGSGETWVDNLQDAKIYAKLGQARSRVTYFANSSRRLPAPTIVELEVSSTRVLDEADRIAKAQRKKELEREQARARQAQYELEAAQRALREAQDRINKLGGGK